MKSTAFVVKNTNAARHSGLLAVRFCPLPLRERSEVMRFLLFHVPALARFTVNHFPLLPPASHIQVILNISQVGCPEFLLSQRH